MQVFVARQACHRAREELIFTLLDECCDENFRPKAEFRLFGKGFGWFGCTQLLASESCVNFVKTGSHPHDNFDRRTPAKPPLDSMSCGDAAAGCAAALQEAQLDAADSRRRLRLTELEFATQLDNLQELQAQLDSVVAQLCPSFNGGEHHPQALVHVGGGRAEQQQQGEGMLVAALRQEAEQLRRRLADSEERYRSLERDYEVELLLKAEQADMRPPQQQLAGTQPAHLNSTPGGTGAAAPAAAAAASLELRLRDKDSALAQLRGVVRDLEGKLAGCCCCHQQQRQAAQT